MTSEHDPMTPFGEIDLRRAARIVCYAALAGLVALIAACWALP